MIQWRPIETAPKTRGDAIIVGKPNYRAGGDIRAWAFWIEEGDLGEWCVIGGMWQPTHWLDVAIPPIPRAQESEAA